MEDFNNKFKCDDAELYYYDFIRNDNSSPVPSEAVDHINSCEICLEKIEQLKRSLEKSENPTQLHNAEIRSEINHILKSHFAYIDKPVSCKDVKPFLPYLSNVDLEIKIPTPITAHLNSCPQCRQDLKAIRSLNLDKYQLSILAQALSNDKEQDSQLSQEKMQKLTDITEAISQRPESGIVTICRIDNDAKAASKDDDLYAGFPITVEQIENTSTDDRNAKSTIPFKTHAASKSVTTRLLKPAMVAAAVIIIAAGLFLSTPTAKAVSIEHLYRAMDKIKNIYIANFTPDSTEPKQEFWFARQQNIYITKTKHETVLYDLDNAQRKIKLPNSDIIKDVTLTEKQASGIKQWMYSYFGVMPFANISDIPADAQWNRVTDEKLINNDNVEVYDLIWTNQESTGSKGYWKYKFYVNAKTYLPFKIAVYRKLNIEEEYILENLKLVKYLKQDEFKAVLKGKGF